MTGVIVCSAYLYLSFPFDRTSEVLTNCGLFIAESDVSMETKWFLRTARNINSSIVYNFYKHFSDPRDVFIGCCLWAYIRKVSVKRTSVIFLFEKFCPYAHFITYKIEAISAPLNTIFSAYYLKNKSMHG